MAARAIANPRDRLVTIMIAPLMTCSARLPVYALLIGAFIPKREVWGGLELQGLVLSALYLAGIVGALAIALVLKYFTSVGRQVRPLMMELPSYHLPTVRNIAIGIWQRVVIFLRRVGTIIPHPDRSAVVSGELSGAPSRGNRGSHQVQRGGIVGTRAGGGS